LDLKQQKQTKIKITWISCIMPFMHQCFYLPIGPESPLSPGSPLTPAGPCKPTGPITEKKIDTIFF
jgi:hypothetical protein